MMGDATMDVDELVGELGAEERRLPRRLCGWWDGEDAALGGLWLFRGMRGKCEDGVLVRGLKHSVKLN